MLVRFEEWFIDLLLVYDAEISPLLMTVILLLELLLQARYVRLVSTSDFFMASTALRLFYHNETFTAVKNHGIPQPVINDALMVAKEFFSLPLEQKMEVDNKKTPNFKGYNSLLSSVNDPDSDGDMHEGFEFGWEELIPKDNDEKRTNDGVMAGANIWPKEPQNFRNAELVY